MTTRPALRASVLPWEHPPELLLLPAQEVHVWRIVLNNIAADPQRSEEVLSDDERQRAARYHMSTHREQFIGGRAALRAILGRYLNLEPNEVRFREGIHGKPALSEDHASSNLSFNVSHADGVTLCAVARGRAVGVDVERIRADIDYEQIAAKFFSPREFAGFQELSPERKLHAFFTCWVRKEAYVKARGDGMWLPFNSFSVSFSPGDAPALLAVSGDVADAPAWSFQDLNPAGSCVGALVVQSCHCLVRQWHFTVLS